MNYEKNIKKNVIIVIRSKNREMYLQKVTKNSLSAFDKNRK